MQSDKVITYCVYGIAGSNGFRSTLDDLLSIGFDWYLEKKRSTESKQTFHFKGKELFGGPLKCIVHSKDDKYYFSWYYSGNNIDDSVERFYWNNDVTDSVYVAVVHR